MNILIKYHNKNIDKIKHFTYGEWIDLRAAETVEIRAGEYKLISLGISIQLPEGYEAHVVPRSSTFKNWGVLQVNHFGVIDNLYCGDGDIWKFGAYATRDTIIHENDRICQFRVMECQPRLKFIEVDELVNADRGGIGSTGFN